MILLLLLFIWSSHGLFNLDLPPLTDEKCLFSRNDAYNCIKQYVDEDRSNSITKEEINDALKKYTNSKTLVWFLGFGVDKIFDACDYNQDGVLSPRDFKMSFKTCLVEKNHLCTIKWFCDRASKHSA